MSVIDELLANAARRDFTGGDLPDPPAKRLAVLACMDARLDLYALLGLAAGDAHVIRNAGGVVTQDALRSLTISQRLLGTVEIMVVQHTGCGMLTITDEAFCADIETETGVRPTWSPQAFADLEVAARDNLARIQAETALPHRDSVRGFVYDVRVGTLREVSP